MSGLESTKVVDIAGAGARLIPRLVGINLAFAALQPVSAGLFLSGYERAVSVHAVIGIGLVIGVLVQAVASVVVWRRGAPAWQMRVSLILFAVVLIQLALGYNKVYWLHVPIGVGLFGWLIRLRARVATLWLAAGAQS